MISCNWLANRPIQPNKVYFGSKIYRPIVQQRIFPNILTVSFSSRAGLMRQKNNFFSNLFSVPSVSNVHLIVNASKKCTGEAFVIFANVDAIETALRKVDGKRIRNTLVKLFRSSQEQFYNYYYCGASIVKTATNTPNRSSSLSSLGKKFSSTTFISIFYFDF